MKKGLLFVMLIAFSHFVMAQDTSILSVITTHDDLDLSDVDLVAIPAHGPYMLAGSTVSSLTEDTELPELVFPDSMMVDDIVWTGKEFIVKSGYEIYRFDKIDEPLIDFDVANYDIFSLDEKRIYAVSHHGDTSQLFLVNLKVKRAKHLLTLGEEIICMSRIGEATMVVTTENIYLFDDNEKKCTHYLNLWTPIHTAVMTHLGLFFATDNEICLLTNVNEFMLLFETRTKKLLYDNRYLYIQLKEGDLLQCNLNMLSF